MTTKIISTYIAAGYSLAAKYSLLDITTTGGVAGYGVKLGAAATIENNAFIRGTGSANGVSAYAAATIINGSADEQLAAIRGYSGVFAPNAPATVTNFGTILGQGAFGNGVFIVDGGAVTNGASNDTQAVIHSYTSGVVADAAARIVNFGTLKGGSGDGLYLKVGGTVTNGSTTDFRAVITGANGIVSAGGALTVTNFRTIQAFGTEGLGIDAGGGGAITNGSTSDTTAVINGVYDGIYSLALTTVTNFGTVASAKRYGIYVRLAGPITNGSTLDTRAIIKGATGGLDILSGAAAINNLGTIEATASGAGVAINGGKVANGSASDDSAVIEGVSIGVGALTASTTITNFGVINAPGATAVTGEAVSLKAGGTITNGSTADTTALIEAEGFGVFTTGLTKIANFGTISGFHGAYLSGGASVTNGSAADTAAVIVGYGALLIRDGVGTVSNLGSIVSYGDDFGVALFNQGAVTNGGATDIGALIEGGKAGVLIDGDAGTVTNFATILADTASSPGASGVYINGGLVTNGAATDKTATITGRYGVFIGAGASATVTNFGTIHGFGGTAVYLSEADDVLNVEAGSVFQGAIVGGKGVLNLASGTGTLSGLTSAGNVTVTGSMAKTTFQNFGALEISAGASCADAGVAIIGAGHTLSNAGTLTLSAAVKNSGLIIAMAGTLTVGGAVTGAGKLTIAGGTADFTSTFTEGVTFAAGSTGVLGLAHSQTYGGTIAGFSKTGANALDLGDIAYVKGTTIATFSGTATSGTLTVTDGTHTAKIKLTGDYRTSVFTTSSDGHGGTLVVDPKASAAPPPTHKPPSAPFVAAMAGFGGAGGSAVIEGPTSEAAPTRLTAPRHATL
jgi:hypothetical protein